MRASCGSRLTCQIAMLPALAQWPPIGSSAQNPLLRSVRSAAMTLQHFLLMVLICTIWGFNFVAAKVGVNEFPPLLFTGLRFSLLALVLIPFLKPAAGRMTDVL